MSHCTSHTTSPVAPVLPAASLLSASPDRRSQAAAIRSTLDEAAALINAQHASVLASVIAMKEANLHRSEFGFSALRDLLLSQFDFTFNTASAIAAIARLSGKFRLLASAAVSGRARIDQVAYAVRQLDQTPAMRLFARTPFTAPVVSPFDPETLCATPEAMVVEYCAHASFKDLRRHLEGLWAAIAGETELLDGLGEQSMQRLELIECGNGMWALEGHLSNATGRMLDKYLQTACPPPRQDEGDPEDGGLLPPQANRHAEAFHQLLAGYGSSPQAATRHGHTATLDLTVDIETLQGKDTGRLPLLEGRPISVARARLLACEGVVIPSVFNYAKGEAVELGRALRLPNAALRRKLELEQPGGCAWHGCDRPIAWTEAHHITHWADGGPTVAENLILLCRFHHGRIHTPGWSVEKTGPGQAIITHHDGHAAAAGTGQSGPADASAGCGCSDWRTDADMDAEHAGSDWDVFPTGLYRTEWSETLKPDLDGIAEAIDRDRAVKAMRDSKAQCRAKFSISQPPGAEEAVQAPPPPTSTATATATAARAATDDYGDPPFLPCPSRRLLGGSAATPRSATRTPKRGFGPSACPHQETHPNTPQHPHGPTHR
ncbi:HNH endonuclease signature motif containing protein [Glycomyces sp. YM15]|uniref:HNH endonuclease signature motif containing protein n=1 Tax=Glycomyces sp. YM15 TaxID=2800446 RepID=UPI001963C6F6|nr:HNH endonuclease signature motif containing protein [Glycomyces sp. YM15]